MSELFAVSEQKNAARLNVVFIHGLGGDARDSWTRGGTDFFPSWISDECEEAAVYSVNYDASPSKWLGDAMPLTDRATEILETLRLNRIFDRPTVFVTHSMGGLVVKKLLHLAVTQNIPEWANIETKIMGIVFIATPHSGADIARYLKALSRVLPIRVAEATQELERNAAQLRELSSWFRNRYSSSKLRCRVYFEKWDTAGFRVVDESSSDPGFPGTLLTPVDADHFTICKPARGSKVHLGVLEFVREFATSAPRVRVPKASLENSKALLNAEQRSLIKVFDDSPWLQSLAVDVINAPSYPTVMSLGEEDYLLPNPVWRSSSFAEENRNLPLANRLRGHMFLSVAQPTGKKPLLKCYYADSWKANLIPFLKHPKDGQPYLEAVQAHAHSHYQAVVRPTGKAIISIKRNEQFKNELWLYCFEFYNLILPNHYRADLDHRWLDLDRLSEDGSSEASVNGDIARALREHFGTGFHGLERSNVVLEGLNLGDS